MAAGSQTLNVIFSVTLDVSEVYIPISGREYFLVMVDTRKLKTVYEFKVWVRFVFAIRQKFEFVVGNAAIHDLNDVQILSLHPFVRIVPIPPRRISPKNKKPHPHQKIPSKSQGPTSSARTSKGNSAGTPKENSARNPKRNPAGTSKGNSASTSKGQQGRKSKSPSLSKSVIESVRELFGSSDIDSNPSTDDSPSLYRGLPGLDDQGATSSGEYGSEMDKHYRDEDMCTMPGPSGLCDDNKNQNPDTSNISVSFDGTDEMAVDDGENSNPDASNISVSNGGTNGMDNEDENKNENNNQEEKKNKNQFSNSINSRQGEIDDHEGYERSNAEGGSHNGGNNSASRASSVSGTKNTSRRTHKQNVKSTQAPPRKHFDTPFSMGQFMNNLRNEASTSQNLNSAELEDRGEGPSGAAGELFDLGDREGNLNSERTTPGKRKRSRKRKPKKRILSNGHPQLLYDLRMLGNSLERAEIENVALLEEWERDGIMNADLDDEEDYEDTEEEYDDRHLSPVFEGLSDLCSFRDFQALLIATARNIFKRTHSQSQDSSVNEKMQDEDERETSSEEDEDEEENLPKKKARGSSDDSSERTNAGALDALRNMRANNGSPSVFKKKKKTSPRGKK